MGKRKKKDWISEAFTPRPAGGRGKQTNAPRNQSEAQKAAKSAARKTSQGTSKKQDSKKVHNTKGKNYHGRSF